MKWIVPVAGAVIAAIGFQKKADAAPQGENKTKYKNWFVYDASFRREASKFGIDWRWLKAIAIVESTLGSNSRVVAGGVSEDGKSYGLMQFTLPTANDLRPGTTPADLNDPEISIALAARYVSQLSKQFGGDQMKTIMSYNQGPGNTAKGKTYALGYYEKWKTAFAYIKEQGQ